MTTHTKPGLRPANPNFSSGPCAKRPGWSVETLKAAALGRSHRAKIGKTKLEQAITLTREILQVPRTTESASFRHRTPARSRWRCGRCSATRCRHGRLGELWLRLGHRCGQAAETRRCPQDRSRLWRLPDLAKIDFDRDVVFTWNGTTSGVRVPNGDFIPADRKG